MRVVIDTNVWISGLLFGGNPQKIIALGKSKQITIICSLPLLNEIIETLNYSKFEKRLLKLGITAESLLSSAYSYMEICPIREIEPIANLRDTDDLKIIATAVTNKAIVIVSGDSDLLVLHQYQGILIMTAKDFLEKYFPNQ
jgi:putative PIN family toxin of toxin-antitoxin system